MPAADQRSWYLLTGEYPPRSGGVGDYSAQIVAGLREAGEQVGVLSPEIWVGDSLVRAALAIDQETSPIILVQYTPMNFGSRWGNPALMRWLKARGQRGARIWLMVHEPFYPFNFPDRPQRWLLAAAHRYALYLGMRAAERVFVSIPAWTPKIAPLGRANLPIEWSPVFSNIPVITDQQHVATIRAQITNDGGPIVACFGAFSHLNRAMLVRVLQRIVVGKRVLLLLGQGGDAIASQLRGTGTDLDQRIVARADLSPQDLSAHLQAADLMLQIYPDGVSTRRGGCMAALAHGRAVVTTYGDLSEPLWKESGCVALAKVDDDEAVVHLAERLLTAPAERQDLGEKARRVYQATFAVAHAIAQLLHHA